MSFPGRNRLRHWFWILMFRYPRLRIWLTRMFVPAREVDVQIFGAPLHISTRDEIGLWRAAKMADDNIIFRDEAATLLNLALLLRPGDVFVDVGANVGLYSSVLSRYRQLFPDTKYVAIEANPATAKRLQQSVAGRDVTVINMGASDRAAQLAFEPGVTSGVFRVTESVGANGTNRISCERLDALPLPAGDLIIKIDVEGHELPVIRGASRLFDEQRIKVVYLDGYSSNEIPPMLQEYGFEFFSGRTLERCPSGVPDFSLLAVHRTRLPQ